MLLILVTYSYISSFMQIHQTATDLEDFRAMNDWCFRQRFCTVKAILGRRQPGRSSLQPTLAHIHTHTYTHPHSPSHTYTHSHTHIPSQLLESCSKTRGNWWGGKWDMRRAPALNQDWILTQRTRYSRQGFLGSREWVCESQKQKVYFFYKQEHSQEHIILL